MRRILSALLVSLITATALPAVPVEASQPVAPVAPVVPHVAIQPSAKVLAERARLRHQKAVTTTTLRAISFAAAAVQTSVARLRAEWQQVAICEVGGDWGMTGPKYSGIGFLNTTWSNFGGTKFARLAGEASRDQQILIGMRVTGGWVPDQYGCSPGGW